MGSRRNGSQITNIISRTLLPNWTPVTILSVNQKHKEFVKTLRDMCDVYWYQHDYHKEANTKKKFLI